jgi:hypothetical protein
VIADFIDTGIADINRVPGKVTDQDWWVKLPGIFPPLVWGIILSVVVLIGYGINVAIGINVGDPWLQGVTTGVALVTYLIVLWLVVTRV